MILNDTLVQAISWTLVHSLWQGILLAVFAGLIILATKKSTAAMRYNLLSVLFVVFLIIVGLTFNYEFTPGLESVGINLPLVSGQVNGDFEAEGVGFSGTIISFGKNNREYLIRRSNGRTYIRNRRFLRIKEIEPATPPRQPVQAPPTTPSLPTTSTPRTPEPPSRETGKSSLRNPNVRPARERRLPVRFRDGTK